ncbi:MAG: hypothetical protein ACPH63_01965 [Flavobacteriaceae bacterium]
MKYLLPLFFVLITACSSPINPKVSSAEVPNEVVEMYQRYNSAWSDGDFNTIAKEIYATPFSLFLQDSTVVFRSEKEIKQFLINTFEELEANDYGYSVRNAWEHHKIDRNLAIIEQNFTRFLKDSTIMGPKERTASYVLRKKGQRYKITGMIPHTPVSK